MAIAIMEQAPDTKRVDRGAFERGIRESTLTPTARLVGLVLASYGDWDGSRIFPSVDTLASGTGKGVRTVFKALGELEHAGFVRRIQRPGRSTYYLLTLPDVETVDTTPATTDTDPCRPRQTTIPEPTQEEEGPAAREAVEAEAVEMMVCQAAAVLGASPPDLSGADGDDAVACATRLVNGGMPVDVVYRQMVCAPPPRSVRSWGAFLITRMKPLGGTGSVPQLLTPAGSDR